MARRGRGSVVPGWVRRRTLRVCFAVSVVPPSGPGVGRAGAAAEAVAVAEAARALERVAGEGRRLIDAPPPRRRPAVRVDADLGVDGNDAMRPAAAASMPRWRGVLQLAGVRVLRVEPDPSRLGEWSTLRRGPAVLGVQLTAAAGGGGGGRHSGGTNTGRRAAGGSTAPSSLRLIDVPPAPVPAYRTVEFKVYCARSAAKGVANVAGLQDSVAFRVRGGCRWRGVAVVDDAPHQPAGESLRRRWAESVRRREALATLAYSYGMAAMAGFYSRLHVGLRRVVAEQEQQQQPAPTASRPAWARSVRKRWEVPREPVLAAYYGQSMPALAACYQTSLPVQAGFGVRFTIRSQADQQHGDGTAVRDSSARGGMTARDALAVLQRHVGARAALSSPPRLTQQSQQQHHHVHFVVRGRDGWRMRGRAHVVPRPAAQTPAQLAIALLGVQSITSSVYPASSGHGGTAPQQGTVSLEWRVPAPAWRLDPHWSEPDLVGFYRKSARARMVDEMALTHLYAYPWHWPTAAVDGGGIKQANKSKSVLLPPPPPAPMVPPHRRCAQFGESLQTLVDEVCPWAGSLPTDLSQLRSLCSLLEQGWAHPSLPSQAVSTPMHQQRRRWRQQQLKHRMPLPKLRPPPRLLQFSVHGRGWRVRGYMRVLPPSQPQLQHFTAFQQQPRPPLPLQQQVWHCTSCQSIFLSSKYATPMSAAKPSTPRHLVRLGIKVKPCAQRRNSLAVGSVELAVGSSSGSTFAAVAWRQLQQVAIERAPGVAQVRIAEHPCVAVDDLHTCQLDGLAEGGWAKLRRALQRRRQAERERKTAARLEGSTSSAHASSALVLAYSRQCQPQPAVDAKEQDSQQFGTLEFYSLEQQRARAERLADNVHLRASPPRCRLQVKLLPEQNRVGSNGGIFYAHNANDHWGALHTAYTNEGGMLLAGVRAWLQPLQRQPVLPVQSGDRCPNGCAVAHATPRLPAGLRQAVFWAKRVQQLNGARWAAEAAACASAATCLQRHWQHHRAERIQSTRKKAVALMQKCARGWLWRRRLRRSWIRRLQMAAATCRIQVTLSLSVSLCI